MAQPVLEHSMPPAARSRPPWPDLVRVGLLVAWLVLLAEVWTVGEHEVPLQQLDAAVSSGDVDTVGVSPGARGAGRLPQEAHWRQGWRRYVVRVEVVTPARARTPRATSPRRCWARPDAAPAG